MPATRASLAAPGAGALPNADKKARRDFSAFARPMPTMKVDKPVLPAAIFSNGAASSFRAKQMSVDI
jgi:hypothetical protein